MPIKLKDLHLKPSRAKRKEPLWAGPQNDGPMGGVTFSMLSNYLCDKERFRLKVIEGLRAVGKFNVPIEFGNMWHVCEEEYAAKKPFQARLKEYVIKLCKEYKQDQDIINHWYNVILKQFPMYIEYWSKHEHRTGCVPIYQEKIFHIPIELPLHGEIYLRGKWDSVDYVKGQGIYVQENKTKSEINEAKLMSQLMFDLQTMLYVYTVQQSMKSDPKLGKYEKEGIRGVRYNVIRRDCPIRRHKAKKSSPEETIQHYYNRLYVDYFQANPEEWFGRWDVVITDNDIEFFTKKCLIPVLENICSDYDWWNYCIRNNVDVFDTLERCKVFKNPPQHYIYPFGIRNILDEGGSTELDNYLMTGSIVGLEYTDIMFRELQP